MAKTQRLEEGLSLIQIDKIHQLHKAGVELCHIMERYGLTEETAQKILDKDHVPHNARWQVRWDDENGKRHARAFESFRAAKMFHNKLVGQEWSKIEKV